MTKVLALVTDCYGGYGGIAQYNQDFVSALSRFDGAPEITVLPRLADEEPGSLPRGVVQLPAIRSRLRYSVKAVWATVRIRPDVIFCGHVYHARLARLVAALVGARVVSQVHGVEVWPALPAKMRDALLSADIVLCVSNDTRNRLIAHEPRLAPICAVVANTVGAAFTPGNRSAARKRFAASHDFLLLSVGRLDKRDCYKGHDRVIPLLQQLHIGERRVRYIIAGKGNDRSRLERLAEYHGVSGLVQFLDAVPHEALPDLYRAADLFVLPSTGEGFGIVFIEAMACGTLAIGLDAGGAGDALCDGYLGIAAAPDDFPAALIDAVRRAHCVSDEARLSLATRTREKFGKDAFERKLETVIRPLIEHL